MTEKVSDVGWPVCLSIREVAMTCCGGKFPRRWYVRANAMRKVEELLQVVYSVATRVGVDRSWFDQ